MATRKTATKTTQKAKLNLGFGDNVENSASKYKKSSSTSSRGGRKSSTSKSTTSKRTVSSNIAQPSKRTQKKVEKTIKKASPVAIIVAILFLVVGLGAGWLTTSIICKNDCFNIVGMDEISIEIGTDYVDQGVKIVAFGKDESASVSIETNLTKNADGSLTSSEEGTFYIKYKSNCFKYGKLFKVEKIRLVSFVLPSEPSEKID